MSLRQKSFSLSIGIPSSLVSEVPHLREKTGVIGQVARAAAIFRVEDIYVYRDIPDESPLMRLILNYVETPQYLRKSLFKRREELRYVGTLPPLRTPHHPVEKRAERLQVGEFREGVVLSGEEGEFLVDIGVEKPIRTTGRAPSFGGRATVQIRSKSPELIGKFVRRREVPFYWGYNVHVVDGGVEKLASHKDFDLKLATSRHAPSLREIEPQIRSRLKDVKSVLVAFGSPRRGLRQMLMEKGLDRDEVFNYTVNTIPMQGCETIRTEEALSATLAIINIMAP